MNSLSSISIVTVVHNRCNTIRNSINSLRQQDYEYIQHLIIDGGSDDGTIDVISDMLSLNTQFISESDNGIYDALNKGFNMSSGDVVGILHSDDVFYDNTVISRVMECFNTSDADYVYGNVKMVNSAGSVVRDWRPGKLTNGMITKNQIPHPSLFIKSDLLNKIVPPFDASYKISADLKQQLIIANIIKAKGVYLEYPVVKMAVGGESTKSLYSHIYGWIESRRAWNEVHGSGGLFYVLLKVLSKIKHVRR